MANAHNCVIHITEPDINKPQGTIITPVFPDQQPRVIFIGDINDLHYVSTVPYKTSINKSRLAYLKRKLCQSDGQKTTQLDKRRKSRSSKTNDEREKRLSKGLKKQIRTDTKSVSKLRQNNAERRAEKTSPDRVKRLAELRDSAAKRIAQEPIDTQQGMLEKKRTASCKNHKSLQNNPNIQDIFDLRIIERKEVLKNIDLFHQTNKYSIKQCIVCPEARPSKSTSDTQETSDYKCLRCIRDKKQPQKFSKEKVPCELQGLTQLEEMLIARALPIMTVFIKPGGQRGYSGHCINLPQHVEELALSLQRCPKELSVIVVKMEGKDNNFKDVSVRRQKVADALLWLINNNPHYKDVKLK